MDLSAAHHSHQQNGFTDCRAHWQMVGAILEAAQYRESRIRALLRDPIRQRGAIHRGNLPGQTSQSIAFRGKKSTPARLDDCQDPVLAELTTV